jgi:small conductance mechanosensitive channel
VVIRCRFKVLPLEQWGVRREYLRRLKKTFDASGIEIPYPHLTVYPGRDAGGRPFAPAVRDAPRAGASGDERPAASQRAK